MKAATYFGKPCRHCSSTLKYVSNRVCVDCSLVSEPKSEAREALLGIPPEFAIERRREKQAQALRLAEVRAQKTAHQRRCLGLSV